MTAAAQARRAMKALVLAAAAVLGALVLEALVPPAALAQTPAATRIGYVDMKRLLDNAPQVVAGREKLSKEFQPRDASLKADEKRLATAIRAMAQVMLAAGASDVDLGGGAPAVRSEAELEAAMQRLDVRRLRLAGFHPSGTAAAGSDPARHPVDPQGRLRGIEGVWVADGSILPSCPGVNPQVSIMAMAAGVGEAAATA